MAPGCPPRSAAMSCPCPRPSRSWRSTATANTCRRQVPSDGGFVLAAVVRGTPPRGRRAVAPDLVVFDGTHLYTGIDAARDAFPETALGVVAARDVEARVNADQLASRRGSTRSSSPATSPIHMTRAPPPALSPTAFGSRHARRPRRPSPAGGGAGSSLCPPRPDRPDRAGAGTINDTSGDVGQRRRRCGIQDARSPSLR